MLHTTCAENIAGPLVTQVSEGLIGGEIAGFCYLVHVS
jgi:hypothetical protein